MRILIAIDGSDHALRAASHVVDLAAQLRHAPEVTLISVHDDTGLRRAKSVIGNQEVADYLRELSEEELAPARKLLEAADLPCDVEIRVGHVAQQIAGFADENLFDLVVMGAKGRGAFADMILGSVAQRVAAMTRQAVLLVK